MKIKLTHKLFLIVILLALVVGFIRDTIVKFSVTRAVRLTTGLDVKIDSLKVGFLLKRFAEIKNLEIRNPKAFPDRVMADIPEIYIDYDLPSVFTNKMFLHEMRLSLKEFSIIKNEKGGLNLDGIKLPKSESPKDVQIGNLRLKIAKIIYRDYSKTPAEVKEFNLNLDERFSHIESLNALARVVLARVVSSTAIKNYINYDADALEASVEDILAESEKVIGGAVGEALRGVGEKIKTIFNKK